MLVPGHGRVEGTEALVQSFVDMCENARVHEFEERDRQIDVFGDAAIASLAFTMVYERSGETYRATGKDVWVFSRGGGGWRAVYRTMLDLAEESVSRLDFTEPR
jgi:ketosteroid isomerase-like protein